GARIRREQGERCAVCAAIPSHLALHRYWPDLRPTSDYWLDALKLERVPTNYGVRTILGAGVFLIMDIIVNSDIGHRLAASPSFSIFCRLPNNGQRRMQGPSKGLFLLRQAEHTDAPAGDHLR